MKRLEESEEKHCRPGNSMNEGPEASEGGVCFVCWVIQFVLFHASFPFPFSEQPGPPARVQEHCRAFPLWVWELLHLQGSITAGPSRPPRPWGGEGLPFSPLAQDFLPSEQGVVGVCRGSGRLLPIPRPYTFTRTSSFCHLGLAPFCLWPFLGPYLSKSAGETQGLKFEHPQAPCRGGGLEVRAEAGALWAPGGPGPHLKGCVRPGGAFKFSVARAACISREAGSPNFYLKCFGF